MGLAWASGHVFYAPDQGGSRSAWAPQVWLLLRFCAAPAWPRPLLLVGTGGLPAHRHRGGPGTALLGCNRAGVPLPRMDMRAAGHRAAWLGARTGRLAWSCPRYVFQGPCSESTGSYGSGIRPCAASRRCGWPVPCLFASTVKYSAPASRFALIVRALFASTPRCLLLKPIPAKAIRNSLFPYPPGGGFDINGRAIRANNSPVCLGLAPPVIVRTSRGAPAATGRHRPSSAKSAPDGFYTSAGRGAAWPTRQSSGRLMYPEPAVPPARARKIWRHEQSSSPGRIFSPLHPRVARQQRAAN